MDTGSDTGFYLAIRAKVRAHSIHLPLTFAMIGGSMATQKKQQPRKSPAKEPKAEGQKKAPLDETQVEETQPVETAVEQPQEEKQEEQKVSGKTKKQDRKTERVIVILSQEDSAFLSEFAISRSALTRAVLRGTREFLEQGEFKTASEMEIVERLRFLLK